MICENLVIFWNEVASTPKNPRTHPTIKSSDARPPRTTQRFSTVGEIFASFDMTRRSHVSTFGQRKTLCQADNAPINEQDGCPAAPWHRSLANLVVVNQ